MYNKGDASSDICNKITNDTSSSEEEDAGIPYTTWKIRECGEQQEELDYILTSPALTTTRTLAVPAHIGEDRLPSLQFPSDHLSLVVDLS